MASDHPNPGNREQAIEKEIQNWPSKNYTTNSAAFQKVKQQAAGVRAYTAEEIAQGAKTGQWASFNQKNGAVFKPTGGTAADTSSTGAATPAPSVPTTSPAVSLRRVQPSEKLVLADLGRMKISRPENWQVMMPKQQGDSLMIAPQSGVMGNTVGYGVVINAVTPSGGGRQSIDQVTAKLIQDMESSGGVQSVGKPQPITIAGLEGRSVVMQSQSPFRSPSGRPQAERDWMVTIPQRDGSVVFLVFVAPEAEFPLFEPTYQACSRACSSKRGPLPVTYYHRAPTSATALSGGFAWGLATDSCCTIHRMPKYVIERHISGVGNL